VPNSTRLWKLLKIAEFRTQTHQDVGKKGSKILKLPPVRNCFTLAMTNKLVAIINSLKVPTIKKILLYEMKFLVPNYSCLQNPWLGGYRPQIPVLSVFCPQLNLLNPPPPEQNSWVSHWTPRTLYTSLVSLIANGEQLSTPQIKDSLHYRVYFVSNFRNFPENSHLGIKTHSLQHYTFGSNQPTINGKMHEDQNNFSPVRQLLLELIAEKLMSCS